MKNVTLRLTDPLDGTSVSASWVGALFALGTRLSRKHDLFSNNQLVLALSVPNRELAAILIGAGWSVSRPPRAYETNPTEVARSAQTGDVYRLVNAENVIAGTFRGFDDSKPIPRIGLGSSNWALNRILALAPAEIELEAEIRMERTSLGSIGRLTGATEDWVTRLAAPAADLALVGTRTKLLDEMSVLLSVGDDTDLDRLSTILSPKGSKAATWFTHLYSTQGFKEELPLPSEILLTVLDGQGAIRYLNDILTPVVVCVFDRSISDQSAAEQVAQLRNTRGTPISLSDEIGWSGHAGIEATCFSMGY